MDDAIYTRSASGGSMIQQTNGGGLSTLAATILIVGEIAGVGILALADASVKAGYASFFLLPFFCILSTYTAHLLCQCWSLIRYSYPEYRGHVPNPYPVIGSKGFGRLGEFVVTTSINLTMFGAMVVFIVLGAQLMHGIFTSWQIGDVTFCLWMIIITAALIPLSWLGTPKDFWWIAVFAMAGTGIACVLIVTNTIRAAPLVPSDAKELRTMTAEDFFLALGTIMFAFSGHPAFPTITIDMKQPENFTKSSLFAYCIVFLMYLPVVILGFVTFGGDINDDIILTLNRYLEQDVMNTLIQSLIFVHLISAFAIVANPVLQHAEELLHVANKFSIKRILVRTGIVIFALFCAESVPRFGILVSLVGSSTNAMLVYVFPCACYLRLKHKLMQQQLNEEQVPLNVDVPKESPLLRRVTLWEKLLLGAIIAIGLFGVVAGTVTSFMNIVGHATFVPPCYVNFTVVP